MLSILVIIQKVVFIIRRCKKAIYCDLVRERNAICNMKNSHLAFLGEPVTSYINERGLILLNKDETH